MFFDTELALFYPENTNFASVAVRIQPEGALGRTWPMIVGGQQRRTMLPGVFESLTTAPFSILVESDFPVVVDRTVRWGASGYGAHAETAVEAAATTWYLAEGSTSGDFALFYLLQNPGDVAASASVRFLRPAPQAPVTKTYALAPHARLTIPVDGIPELASTDVSGVVTATQPIVVERAMYLNRPDQPFAAGHGSAGVTTPATSWFLAEGATGSFFELFVLIANPSLQAAAVRVDYLLPGGGTLSKQYARGAGEPLHHLGRRRAAAGRVGPAPACVDGGRHAGDLDQLRAHHRRAVDVVAPAVLVRGAQRSRHDGDGDPVGRWREASSAVPIRPRPTSSSPTPPRPRASPACRCTSRTAPAPRAT